MAPTLLVFSSVLLLQGHILVHGVAGFKLLWPLDVCELKEKARQ